MHQSTVRPILFGLCSVLIACESQSRNLTGPESDAGTLDLEGVSLLAPSNTWATMRSTPTTRTSAVAGTIGSTIYVIGGQGGTASTRVEAYNAVTNSWSTRRSLPSARMVPNGASAINGKLYVTGGQSSSSLSSSLYVYTPGTNTWAKKANMPSAGGCGAQAVIIGSLYVYTGCTNVTNGHKFFRYSPSTNTWQTLKAPPSQHDLPGGAGVINGQFYLAGGTMNNGDNVNPALHVYSPKANAWATKAPMSVPRACGVSAVLNGKLYVAGGYMECQPDPDPIQAMLSMYDPVTNRWLARASMPTGRVRASGAAADGRLFVIGGLTYPAGAPTASSTRKVEAYTP